jgi:N-acetylmuramoyl-L-alanine amidase
MNFALEETMLRILKFTFILVIIMSLQIATVFADDTSVRLKLDGNDIIANPPAIIVSERTMVPARAVFEAMGAKVEWNEELREVTVTLNSSIIKVNIDSDKAFVNGILKGLDVPAMIISERTLVPLRFIAEAAGLTVAWDDLSRTVSMTSPIKAFNVANINSISMTGSNSQYLVSIKGDSDLTCYKNFMLKDPLRVVIDIDQAKLTNAVHKLLDTNEIVKGVRFSQFEAEKVRVVLDLINEVPILIELSEDKKELTVKVNYKDGDTQENPYGFPALDWRATNMLVIIDPGHGGKDTGAIGFENGVGVIYEKDINLDVANRLSKLLSDVGVKIYSLRTDDSSIGLYERPSMANSINGDLYVSIHNNSSDSGKPSGVETLYYTKANEAEYLIKSMRMAEIAQGNLLASLGLANRGISSRPELAVLNKTVMPSIIIEGGFLSNYYDLAIMKTDGFRENYAVAVARTIITALNESVANQ